MSQVSLPLLARELTELAMRRRTYVVRVIYAASLLFICWLAFQLMVMGRSGRALDYLGSGKVILWWVGYLQNIGMFLVLPALACDVFTREKERQTIGLLFLTRLTPWTIVFEKFLSRLFPAICLLLISLPLLGLSYSLGGVEVWQIVNSALGLAMNAIVLTAIAVACSSLCYTTTAAFLWSYLVLLVSPLMVVSGDSVGEPFDFIAFGKFFTRAIYLNFPAAPSGLQFGGSLTGSSWGPGGVYAAMLASCVPSLLMAAVCLALARIFLVHRAFKVPARRTPWWSIKVFSRSKSPSQTSNIPIGSWVNDGRGLPDESPVAWRQTQKAGLGNTSTRLFGLLLVQEGLLWLLLTLLPTGYQLRQVQSAGMVYWSHLWLTAILAGYLCYLRIQHRSWVTGINRRVGMIVALQTLFVLLIALHNAGLAHPKFGLITVLCLSLWLAVLLLLVTSTAGLITQERGQQTLFVLLTTPLTGPEILRQKMAGVWSLCWMSLIPLLTCILVRLLSDMPEVQAFEQGRRMTQVDYPMAILNEATMLVIYPQLAIWGALYFSLRSRTTIAAIMKSILSIAFLCVLPWLILLLIVLLCGGLSDQYFGPIVALLMIGPADLLLYGYEFDCIPPGFDQSLWPVVLNSMIHGGLWWWLRRECLNKADHLLGRGERRSDKPVLT